MRGVVAAGGGVEVEVLTALDAVRGVADDWSDLLDRALDSEPFLGPEWLVPWWEAFDPGPMAFVAARSDGRLIGVAPLYVANEQFLWAQRRVLRLWGNAYCPRPNVLLDAERAPEAASALVRGMLSLEPRWRVARLGPMAVAHETTRVLGEALSRSHLRWGIREAHASPFLRLPDSWEGVLPALSGSFRETVRRKGRKAERRGDVSVEFAGGRGADANAAFAISEHTWQHAEGTGIGSTGELEQFFRGMAEGAARRGWLDMAYLLVGGEPAAFEFNLRHRGKIYNLKLGYRQEVSELSPGIVLKQHVLRRAIADGVVEYDFLGAAEPYKLHWTEQVRQLGEIWVVRSGLIPRAAHVAYFRLRPFMVRRLPWLMDLSRRVRTWRAGAQ